MTTKLTVERWAKYLENEADGAVHYDDPHPYVWLELDDARAIACTLRSVRETALAEGRERGLEEAAKVADAGVYDEHALAQATDVGWGYHMASKEIAADIRSLSRVPATEEVKDGAAS